LVDVDN